MDLSIIILTYNTKDITLECLKHLTQADFGEIKVEVIVVDNASSDGTTDKIQNSKLKVQNRDVKIIKNVKNLGFAAGNNVGIKETTGEYILLLNSDVMVETDTLANHWKFVNQQPQFAASTCRLLLSNGSMDPACFRGFPTPWASFTYLSGLERLFPHHHWFSAYHLGWLDRNQIQTVDVVSGGFLWIKHSVLDKIGLFDEQFFMYAEDIDLCMRLKQAGYYIGYNPAAKALHLKGTSGRKVKSMNSGVKSNTERQFWFTMRQFYKKHYVQKYPFWVNWLVFKAIDWKLRSGITSS